MKQWTKKAAIERMNNNQELQQVYEKYPLARLLVESASQLRRYPGYNRISCYYAYKDWMWAVTGVDRKDGWVCVKVIADLLPSDVCDLEIEGSSISTFNPNLPGLPPRPERVGYTGFVSEMPASIGEREEARRLGMWDTLWKISQQEVHV